MSGQLERRSQSTGRRALISSLYGHQVGQEWEGWLGIWGLWGAVWSHSCEECNNAKQKERKNYEVTVHCYDYDPVMYQTLDYGHYRYYLSSRWICMIKMIVVPSLNHVQLFVTPWTAALQASLSFAILWSLLKLMSIESVMPFISSSVALFFFCPQALPASVSFPVSWLFISSGQSIETSASASVLSMNIQGWFPLGLTSLISLLSKGLWKPIFYQSLCVSVPRVQRSLAFCSSWGHKEFDTT